MSARDIWAMLLEAGREFIKDRGPKHGAALAFYGVLSIAPLAVIIVAVVGTLFGEAAAQGELVSQLSEQVGPETAETIEGWIAQTSLSGKSWLAGTIAVVVMLFAASGIFVELQDTLNTVWHVQPKRIPGGVMGWIRARALTFLLVGSTAGLLLASVVISAILSGVQDHMPSWFPGSQIMLELANFLITLGLVTVLFAMIFKMLPHVYISWSDVWMGALVTAALFSLGKYLIGLYLGMASFGSTYGAAGTLMALLMWIYYSTQILIFGAELTFVYARRFGGGVRGSSVGAE